jgi:hypothetical protein
VSRIRVRGVSKVVQTVTETNPRDGASHLSDSVVLNPCQKRSSTGMTGCSFEEQGRHTWLGHYGCRFSDGEGQGPEFATEPGAIVARSALPRRLVA